MKKGIHPNYGPAVIKCACGNEVRTQAVVPEIEVEICSSCHPFYTGKKKIVDSTGRVDRFMKRMSKTQNLQQKTKPQKKSKKKPANKSKKPASKTPTSKSKEKAPKKK